MNMGFGINIILRTKHGTKILAYFGQRQFQSGTPR
jgi:hypothetical protein